MTLESGAWAGRRCFIVGGGPSLRGFDFSRLAGELTIGINAAWRMSPTVAFALGHRFNGAQSERGWHEHHERVFMSRRELLRGEADLQRLLWGVWGGSCFFATEPDGLPWSETLTMGRLAHGPGGGAGTPAVNLAWLLGARPIYLLGFEHRGEGGKTANFHEHYPEDWQRGEEVYEPMRADLERHAELLRGEVIDLSPNGTLRGFERAAVDDVLA